MAKVVYATTNRYKTTFNGIACLVCQRESTSVQMLQHEDGCELIAVEQFVKSWPIQ